MLYRLYRMAQKVRKPKITPVTEIAHEVEITVGGITDDGIIYEKKVYPDGKDLLYKEVRIDDTQKEEESTDNGKGK